MDGEIDKNIGLVKEMHDDVDKLDEEIVTMNKDMKVILEKMRTPGKFCMDIIFLVICCFLLGMFVFILKKYYYLKNENSELLSHN